MSKTSASIHENTSRLIANVFNCCPTMVQHQIMQHMELKFINKDTLFIHPQDQLGGIYLVIEGAIKIYQEKKTGRHVIHYHTSNDVIGLSGIITGDPANYFAYTMHDSILAFIPKTVLFKLMTAHPLSFFSLMKKLNEKIERIENRGVSIMIDSPEKAVIKAVNDLASRFGTDTKGYIKIHIPVKELASYIGMSKTNLYRILQSLKQKKILFHHLDKYRLEKKSVS